MPERLGPYEILDLIGRGGMGEVHRARDTRLGRDVAIKVLPREMSTDPERLARFDREARALATLQHPNVASVYGFEEIDGTRLLVMELVEGEDLSLRLKRGPFPVDEAIEIAVQIATGLAAAHDKGIVHRDLKPANVKLAPDGTVKILDFGLARAIIGDAADGDLANSPTITAAMTQAGVVLGTASYMSPEQAKGRPVDEQADVFAFGCVLYECLTGKQAFPGDTITEVLASVLRAEPDWSALPDSTPRRVRRVLHWCLEKKAQDRLRDLGDAALLLREIEEEPQAVTTAPARRSRLWPGMTAALALAVIALLLRGNDVPTPGTGTTMTGMTQLTDLPGLQLHPALSADARQFLYTSRDGADFDVFLQRVGGENAVNLTADSPLDDVQATFSPDGDRIAFASERQGGGIFVMGATGESPRRVAPAGYDPEWSPDGTRIVYTEEFVLDPYSRSGHSNLWVVELASGGTRPLDDVDAAGPSWSPNGHRIAFWTHLETIQGQRDIWTIPADGGDPSPVLIDRYTDWDPVWSLDGAWLYFVSDRGGTPDVWRIAIDEVGGEARGEPEPVTASTSNVVRTSNIASGRMAVVERRDAGSILRIPVDPVTVEPTGEIQTLASSSHTLWQLDAPLDPRWVTYGTMAPRERLYLMAADGSTRRKLVDDEFRNRGLSLSPNGTWAAYYSNRDGQYDLWVVRADGTGHRNLTRDTTGDFNDPSWLSDGTLVAASYAAAAVIVRFDRAEQILDAGDEPTAEFIEPAMEFVPWQWSPDGRRALGLLQPDYRIAFASTDDWQAEPIEIHGRRTQAEDGDWIDDRRILLWDAGKGSAFVYDVGTKQAEFVSGYPGPAQYQVSADGRTVFANHRIESSEIWLLEFGALEPVDDPR